jgi:phage terminase large subunit-like protein
LAATSTRPKVLRQIRGGLDKTNEGALLITTTQSDEIPAGAFKDELYMARKIRDGHYRGAVIRPMLPVLYEFPTASRRTRSMGRPGQLADGDAEPGRSVHLHDLIPDWNSEKEKGDRPTRIWASQHLNIEMGIGMKTDGWAGVEFWAAGRRRHDHARYADRALRGHHSRRRRRRSR